MFFRTPSLKPGGHSGATGNLRYFFAQMNHTPEPSKPRSVVSVILTDIHFWIPAGVLVFGLWVLHWTR
jgi:hypothetical protein